MAKYDVLFQLDVLGEENAAHIVSRVSQIWVDVQSRYPMTGFYVKKRKPRSHEPIRVDVLFEDMNGQVALDSLRDNEARLIRALPGVAKMTTLIRAGTGAGMFEVLELPERKGECK